MPASSVSAYFPSPGRPGVNPLAFHYAADPAIVREVVEMHKRFGWWIAKAGEPFEEVVAKQVHGLSRQADLDGRDQTAVDDVHRHALCLSRVGHRYGLGVAAF